MKAMQPHTLKPLFGCVTVDVDPSRMLQLSRPCASLPAFVCEALRTCPNPSVRFHPGEWLVIVVGNELFLWKYSTSPQVQPQSTCLHFSLPASDMPHSASLVGLIFPSVPGSVSAPVSPTSCLALSACGENLRLWPRLVRNSIHNDVALASTADLFGDEAVQLEPTSVPGAFVLATRTGRLILVDPRNIQHGVSCRPLVSTNKPDSYVASGSAMTSTLFSGIGRRVSNLFGLVNFSSGAGSHFTSARSRGGQNMFFVRLITRPQATPSGTCFLYMLLGHQLEVWSLDQSLKEQMHSIFTVESLLRASLSDSPIDGWHAVDMAVQYTRGFISNNELVYVLICNTDAGLSMYHLLTLSLTECDSNAQFCQNFSISLVPITWPFGLRHQHDTVQFCLPSAHSTDMDLPSVYPCLLACLYCVFTGQVAIIEVLTGHLVAKLQFGQHSDTNDHTRLPVASVLLGCGGMESNSLFAFVTAHRGLLSLMPVTGSLIPSTSSHMTELSSVSVRDSSKAFKVKSSTLSIDSVASEQPRPRLECMPVVLVRTHDKGLIRVAVQLTSGLLSFWDPSDTTRTAISLSHDDLTFAALSETARVYWMGFREQAIKYLCALLKETELKERIAPAFLRLGRRILNECPMSDARWHSILTSPTDDSDKVIPEGCSNFQYVAPKLSSTAPVHPVHRFEVKQEAIQRVKELWTLASESSRWLCVSGVLIDVSTACRHLGFALSTSDSGLDLSVDSEVGVRRCFAGEVDMVSDVVQAGEDSDAVERYACMLADDSNEVEDCARRLLRSWDPSRILQAAEDEPADCGSDRCSKLHVLSGLYVCEELIEFARAMYLKLVREPRRYVQPVLQSVAMEAGYSTDMLQTLDARDVIFQTLTLIPYFVARLGDAVARELDTLAGNTGTSPPVVPFHLKSQIVVSSSSVEMLREAAELLSAGLCAVSTFRDCQISSIQSATVDPSRQQTHYLLCWLTDARPFGVGDVLLELFDRLVQLGSGEWSLSCDPHESSESAELPDMMQLTKDAASMAIEWADNILTLARQRVHWATASSLWAWSLSPDSFAESDLSITKRRLETIQRLRRMRFWFVQLRKRLIDAIADRLLRPEAALVLAEHFADCNQMVRLCYLLEVQNELSSDESAESGRPHHQWLAELLKRVPTQYGLADHALQWYFSCGEHARVQSLLTLLERLKRSEPPAGVEHPPDSAISGFPRSTKSQLIKPSADHLEKTSDPVYRFLHREDARDHAWPHLLSIRHYTKAAHIMFEEGCKELRFVGRRKTLFSLAKLAIITSDSDTSHPDSDEITFTRNQLVTKIDLLLEWISFQENLPGKLRANSLLRTLSNDNELGTHHDPVLSVEDLARLYVSSVGHTDNGDIENSSDSTSSISPHECDQSFRCGLAEFRTAFRLADLLVDVNDLSLKLACSNPLDTRDALLTHIWCQALKMNHWPDSPDQDPVQLFGRSFICQLVREVGRMHQSLAEPLFYPEKLLACPALEAYANNLHFRYLVHSGLEFLQSLI